MSDDKVFSDADLLAYLDEGLDNFASSAVEQAIRRSPDLKARLEKLVAARESDSIMVGEVWSRNRLSCPSRESLGSFLLNALSEAESDFIDIHLQISKCAICLANLEDLRRAMSDDTLQSSPRIQKYFQSSIGRLSNSSKP